MQKCSNPASVTLDSMEGKRRLDTDDIVAEAMQEEEGRKRLKRSVAPMQQGPRRSPHIVKLMSRPLRMLTPMRPAVKASKGLTLSEVEAAEGGTVKEGLSDTSQHKRGLQRKRKAKGAGVIPFSSAMFQFTGS